MVCTTILLVLLSFLLHLLRGFAASLISYRWQETSQSELKSSKLIVEIPEQCAKSFPSQQ